MTPSSKAKYRLFFAVTVIFTVLDQISKIWVVHNIKGPRMAVPGINILDKFGVDFSDQSGILAQVRKQVW